MASFSYRLIKSLIVIKSLVLIVLYQAVLEVAAVFCGRVSAAQNSKSSCLSSQPTWSFLLTTETGILQEQ